MAAATNKQTCGVKMLCFSNRFTRSSLSLTILRSRRVAILIEFVLKFRILVKEKIQPSEKLPGCEEKHEKLVVSQG
jgi:hypothetical protein